MKISVRDALRRGIAAHKAGNFEEAEKFYRAIIQSDTNHSDANHNMGVLAVGVGKLREAIPFFETAVKVNPDVAQYWISYINALVKSRQYKKASDVLGKSKKKYFAFIFFASHSYVFLIYSFDWFLS